MAACGSSGVSNSQFCDHNAAPAQWSAKVVSDCPATCNPVLDQARQVPLVFAVETWLTKGGGRFLQWLVAGRAGNTA